MSRALILLFTFVGQARQDKCDYDHKHSKSPRLAFAYIQDVDTAAYVEHSIAKPGCNNRSKWNTPQRIRCSNESATDHGKTIVAVFSVMSSVMVLGIFGRPFQIRLYFVIECFGTFNTLL